MATSTTLPATEAEDQDYFQRYPNGCTPPFPRPGVEAASRETAA
jgi:hypothetical protein